MTDQQRERKAAGRLFYPSGGVPDSGDFRVFVSYRHEDAAAHAGRLADRLVERFGQDYVFMDIDSIDPGLDFREVLTNAINACDVLVVAIGRNWLNIVDKNGQRRLDIPDDYVRLEIEAALERDVRIIPVLLDGAEMPTPGELPEQLAPFCYRNAVEIGKHFHTDADDLLSRLEKIERSKFGEDGEQAPPAHRAPPPRAPRGESLAGTFRFGLPLSEATVACVEAIDGLGWQIENVESKHIVSYADTGSTGNPSKIEVELDDLGGQSTDVGIIGTHSHTGPRAKDELVADLNRVRYAIEARVQDAIRASAPQEQPRAPRRSWFDRNRLGLALGTLLAVGAVATGIVIASSGGGSASKGGTATSGGMAGMSHLQTVVPEFAKWKCLEGQPSSPTVDEQAVCRPPQGADSVQLALFKNMGAVNAAYAKQVDHAGLVSPTKIRPNTGHCTAQSWGGEGKWVHAPGVPAGRRLCYLTTSHASYLIWSYDDTPLLVNAHRADEAHGLLNDWFNVVAHDIGAGGQMNMP